MGYFPASAQRLKIQFGRGGQGESIPSKITNKTKAFLSSKMKK